MQKTNVKLECNLLNDKSELIRQDGDTLALPESPKFICLRITMPNGDVQVVGLMFSDFQKATTRINTEVPAQVIVQKAKH